MPSRLVKGCHHRFRSSRPVSTLSLEKSVIRIPGLSIFFCSPVARSSTKAGTFCCPQSAQKFVVSSFTSSSPMMVSFFTCFSREGGRVSSSSRLSSCTCTSLGSQPPSG